MKFGMYILSNKANNIRADQPVMMRRLVCAFGVRMRQSQVFSQRGSFSTSLRAIESTFDFQTPRSGTIGKQV